MEKTSWLSRNKQDLKTLTYAVVLPLALADLASNGINVEPLQANEALHMVQQAVSGITVATPIILGFNYIGRQLTGKKEPHTKKNFMSLAPLAIALLASVTDAVMNASQLKPILRSFTEEKYLPYMGLHLATAVACMIITEAKLFSGISRKSINSPIK